MEEEAREGRPATTRLMTLQTSNEKRLVVNQSIITAYSRFLRNMAEDVNIQEEKPVPLSDISCETLQKVVEFCEYRNNVDIRRRNGEDPAALAQEMKTWEEQFVKMDMADLLKLIMAADFLVIEPLADLTAGAISKFLIDKPVDQIRRIFNITNDFTEEEEEAVRNENHWAFE